MDKKTPSRFCIQFNDKDSRHQQVMRILNEQGRHKAQYIATAVIHYINCTNEPSIPQDDVALRSAVESIVESIMCQRNAQQESVGRDREQEKKQKPRRIRESVEIGLDDSELDEDTLNVIRDSLAAFQSMDK